MFLSDLLSLAWSLQNASIWKGLTGRNVALPLSHFFFALFCQTRARLKLDWSVCNEVLKHSFPNWILTKVSWEHLFSCFNLRGRQKKVNFRTVMVQPWGIELCNFPIWYDKGIIDLVTLISNLLLHWRIKKRFSAPCFSTFFYLSMSPRLSSHYR